MTCIFLVEFLKIFKFSVFCEIFEILEISVKKEQIWDKKTIMRFRKTALILKFFSPAWTLLPIFKIGCILKNKAILFIHAMMQCLIE